MLLLEPATEKRGMPPLFEGDLPPVCAAASVPFMEGEDGIALVKDYAPPRARHNLRAFSCSLCLHCLVVLLAFAVALVEPDVLAVQGGGAISVSLVLPQEGKAGAASASKTAVATQAEAQPVSPPEKSETVPATPPPDAVPVSAKKVTPPPKKPQEAPRPAQKLPPKKTKADAPAQAPVTAKQLNTPKEEKSDSRDNSDGSGAASGDKGNASATIAAASGGNAAAVAPTVGWNSAGGPRFLRQAPLRYPRMAQRRNQEGKATVEAHLDAGGKLLRARIVQADQEDFGKAALDCVQSSTFAPAQSGGKPMACVVRIPMLFVLRDL